MFRILALVGTLLAPVHHIAVTATSTAPTVKPGATVSLFVDVLPNDGIHVYAPGATDYQPIGLKLDASDVAAGKLVYPKSETLTIPETGEKIPVYNKAFRLTQPVTVSRSAKPGTKIVVSGVVQYQACDDRVCFRPAELPVSWTLDVK
jgi:Disulphide bond corrector protein DsbC